MGVMESDDSWSLIAVVKECARKAKVRDFEDRSPTTSISTITIPEVDHLGRNHSSSQNSYFNQVVPGNNLVHKLPSAAGVAVAAPAADYRGIEDEFRDLCKPLLLPPPPPPPVICTVNTESAAEASGNLPVEQNSHQQLHLRDFQINPKQRSLSAADHDQCFQKKKKFEDRRVVRVTLEELSRYDKWAWRKYGQKPIKGSPYPRNYYRCSSTKGCKARKQVERSPVDPFMYIVTYTSHHQHPLPPIRTSGAHRVKNSGCKQNPTPEIKYPTSTLPVPVYRYGYEYVLGGNDGVKIEDKEYVDEDGGCAGDHESFGSGVMDEGCNQYNGNIGFNEKLVHHSRVCDPIVVQLNGNGMGYGIGIGEMYASAQATLMVGAPKTPSNTGVQNIWDNGMTRPQTFLFSLARSRL